MELSTELDFGLDKLGILTECLLRQLDAKHELASVGHLILILNIWVHITEKQLLLILIGETDSNALICLVAIHSQLIIHLDESVESVLIQDLNFNLERVVANDCVFEASPLVRLSHIVNSLANLIQHCCDK